MVPKVPVQAQGPSACVDVTEHTWPGTTSVECTYIFPGQGTIILITFSGELQSFCGLQKSPSHPNGFGIEALKRMMQRLEHLTFPSFLWYMCKMISPLLSLWFTGVVCIPSFKFTSCVIMSKISSLLCLNVSWVMSIAQYLLNTAILKFRLDNGFKGMYLEIVKIMDVNVKIVDPGQIIFNSSIFPFPWDYVTGFLIPRWISKFIVAILFLPWLMVKGRLLPESLVFFLWVPVACSSVVGIDVRSSVVLWKLDCCSQLCTKDGGGILCISNVPDVCLPIGISG